MLRFLLREHPHEPPSFANPVIPTLPASTPARLQPPRVNHPVIAHERLLGLWPDPETASVVTVIAPAGYGKSTLMADWVGHADGPVIWMSVDRQDDDPATMASGVALAIMRAWPGAAGLEEAIAAPSASIWSTLMPRIASALQAMPPYIQVFDDIHETTSSESLDVINWLALHVPPRSQLIVGGRSANGFVSPRLRVQRRLVEIGMRQLRLADAEAEELLRSAGLDLSRDEVASLNRACEGWISGLLLAAMSDRAPYRADRAIQPPDGADYVGQYLRSEVLSRLAPDEVEFLLQTSILREASGPLCDAVRQGSGSAVLLEQLCDSNAFVQRVAGDRCRYHELFREALRAELTRAHPEDVPLLRARAAEWHAARAEAAEAVQYAQESGLTDLSTRLISVFALAHFNSGQSATVLGWLDDCESAGTTLLDPGIPLAGSMVYALMGDAARSERWAKVLDRMGGGDGPAGPAGSVEASRALLSAVLCRAGVNDALVDAIKAYGMVPVDSPWRGATVTALALCQLMCGLHAESDAALREVVDPSRAGGPDVNGRSLAFSLLARRALEEHDLETARSLLHDAQALRAEGHITGQGPQAVVDALSARLALAADADIVSGKRYLAHAQTVRPLLTWAMPALALVARLDLVRAHLAVADPAGARLLLREIGDILRHRPGLGTLEVEAEQLREQVSEHRETALGPSVLTVAELRLVPWLATHLSFREIGERLFVSGNTVKTEALSIYRKLGASSRSEAVEAAVHVGLLDPAAVPGILHAAVWVDPDSEGPFTSSG